MKEMEKEDSQCGTNRITRSLLGAVREHQTEILNLGRAHARLDISVIDVLVVGKTRKKVDELSQTGILRFVG